MRDKDILKDFPLLEDALKAIENLKKHEFPIYSKKKYPKKEDCINVVYSIIEKEFKILPPNLLLPTSVLS
jgi:hypothetical protein